MLTSACSILRCIGHIDADLAVLDLAEPAAPLPSHAHRLGPLLGEGRGVEHDHAVGFAQVLADLARSVVSRGAWSHGTWPMNFWMPWRS